MVQDASGRSGFADQLLPALKDPLFLVVCILLSISCLLSLSAGSVPLIDILITVFLWLTYAQARKDIADAGHLRCVSGALYAQYVIVYVVAGLLLVVGVILMLYFANGFQATAEAISFNTLHEAEGVASVAYVALALMGIAAGAQFCENILYRQGNIGDLYSSGTIFWMNLTVGIKVITGIGSISLLMLALVAERQGGEEV